MITRNRRIAHLLIMTVIVLSSIIIGHSARAGGGITVLKKIAVTTTGKTFQLNHAVDGSGDGWWFYPEPDAANTVLAEGGYYLVQLSRAAVAEIYTDAVVYVDGVKAMRPNHWQVVGRQIKIVFAKGQSLGDIHVTFNSPWGAFTSPFIPTKTLYHEAFNLANPEPVWAVGWGATVTFITTEGEVEIDPSEEIVEHKDHLFARYIWPNEDIYTVVVHGNVRFAKTQAQAKAIFCLTLDARIAMTGNQPKTYSGDFNPSDCKLS